MYVKGTEVSKAQAEAKFFYALKAEKEASECRNKLQKEMLLSLSHINLEAACALERHANTTW